MASVPEPEADHELVVASSTSAKTELSFTCFNKLPPELRVMIWDEALVDYRVIFMGEWWSRWSYFSDYTLKRYGIDFVSVALSCQEAAARWRLLNPVCTLLVSPTIKLRLDPNRTLFVAKSIKELGYFLKLERPDGSLQGPLHVGFMLCQCWYDKVPLDEQEAQQTLNGVTKAAPASNSPRPEVQKRFEICGMKEQVPAVESLVKIRGIGPCDFDIGSDLNDNRTEADIAPDIIRGVWNSGPIVMRCIRDAKGTDVAQILRHPQGVAEEEEAVEDEESSKGDTESAFAAQEDDQSDGSSPELDDE